MRRIISAMLVTLLLGIGISFPGEAAMSPNKKQKALEKVRYLEFTGKQQDWPVTQKATTEVQGTRYGTPIYYDLPGKHYEILGTFQATGDNVIKHAAEAAQAVGADAILAVADKAFTDAGLAVNPQSSARGSNIGKLKLLEGIFIRWKRESAAPTPPPSTTSPADAAH